MCVEISWFHSFKWLYSYSFSSPLWLLMLIEQYLASKCSLAIGACGLFYEIVLSVCTETVTWHNDETQNHCGILCLMLLVHYPLWWSLQFSEFQICPDLKCKDLKHILLLISIWEALFCCNYLISSRWTNMIHLPIYFRVVLPVLRGKWSITPASSDTVVFSAKFQSVWVTEKWVMDERVFTRFGFKMHLSPMGFVTLAYHITLFKEPLSVLVCGISIKLYPFFLPSI